MMKSIGLLLAVAAIWATVEIYTQGVDQAFGGRLATLGLGSGDGEAPRASAPKRAGAAVERAHAQQKARYDELIPE